MATETLRGRLVVQNICVNYGAFRALDGVSIDVAPGSITGVIGPNGSGKTTLINAITGIQAASGTIRLDGQVPGSPFGAPSGGAWRCPYLSGYPAVPVDVDPGQHHARGAQVDAGRIVRSLCFALHVRAGKLRSAKRVLKC